MKTLLIILSLALTLSAQASQLEVIDSHIGLNDYSERPTLCLTIVRDTHSGELLGILEDITDCFYARKAARNPSRMLEISSNALSKNISSKMLVHLQAFDPALQFVWSNHE